MKMRIALGIIWSILIIQIILIPTNANIIAVTGSLEPIQQNQYEITIIFPQAHTIYYIEELNLTINGTAPTKILTTIVNIRIFNLTIIADNTIIYQVTLKMQENNHIDLIALLITNIIGLIPVSVVILLLMIKYPIINKNR